MQLKVILLHGKKHQVIPSMLYDSWCSSLKCEGQFFFSLQVNGSWHHIKLLTAFSLPSVSYFCIIRMKKTHTTNIIFLSSLIFTKSFLCPGENLTRKSKSSPCWSASFAPFMNIYSRVKTEYMRKKHGQQAGIQNKFLQHLGCTLSSGVLLK